MDSAHVSEDVPETWEKYAVDLPLLWTINWLSRKPNPLLPGHPLTSNRANTQILCKTRPPISLWILRLVWMDIGLLSKRFPEVA
jgi:hypothetical protein